MTRVEVELSPQQRERLARKGRLLYGKFCGTNGQGSCAESFALYHIGRGATEVAGDLLAYLEAQARELRDQDPEGRLAMTEELAERIRQHLKGEAGAAPESPLRTSLLEPKDRRGATP